MNGRFLSQSKKEKEDGQQEEKRPTFSTDVYFKAAQVGLGTWTGTGRIGNRRTAANGVREGSLLFLSSMAII